MGLGKLSRVTGSGKQSKTQNFFPIIEAVSDLSTSSDYAASEGPRDAVEGPGAGLIFPQFEALKSAICYPGANLRNFRPQTPRTQKPEIAQFWTTV